MEFTNNSQMAELTQYDDENLQTEQTYAATANSLSKSANNLPPAPSQSRISRIKNAAAGS